MDLGTDATMGSSAGEAAVGGVSPSQLFELERRTHNVQGLATGCLVASASILLFVPVEWFLLREYFFMLQSLTLFFLGPLVGVWFAIQRSPKWAIRHVDNLVFGLFVFLALFSTLLCSLDTGYDSPYSLTILFSLMGVNVFISWTAKRAAAFGLCLQAVFVAPLFAGFVPLGDPKIASIYQGIILGTALILGAFQRHRLSLEKKEFLSRHELKSTKDSLEKAYEQLKEVDRLKSEFFANVSHELRTPLTLILSPVDDLLDKLEPSAERNALKVVRRNATRLLRMIDDLLDLARLEAGGLRLRVRDVDLCELTRRVAENAMPAAETKGIQLEFHPKCEPVTRYGDPHRIEIILTNLIGNAMKFTPRGGKIDVAVFHNSAGTSIEVSDTGPGISKEEQERIFRRFHQTETSERRRQGGVGIGLALARELAQLHGGSLTVESQVGEGSTFTLFLKSGKDHFHTEIMERRQMQTAHHPGRRIDDRTTGVHTREGELDVAVKLRLSSRPPDRVLLDRGRVPRILVAEDEVDLRGFIVESLADQYEIDAAANGAEALEHLERQRPDLVLTDVMMPEVSGLDLTRHIKGDPSLRHIPVILLTARGESEAALEGYRAGADDFVSKPFHTKVLQARIRAHLKMRGLSLQLADQARLASAGTLAAGLAHEVKNPLNAALNAAKVLERGGSSRVSADRLWSVIINALERIDGVISALDAHARPADGDDVTPCDVQKAVRSTLDLLEHKMKHITVHEDFEMTGAVFAPARAFNQVVLNLVDNSVRSGASNLWIELQQVDNRILVAVADDGPGVPADVVHRIFDPFFTTRDEGEGTGLGLHLSRRIAQECGGELRYEPRPGGGARFVMEIPAMEQAA